MGAQYLLSADAHICVLRASVVLLDLSSGKYLSMSPEQSSAAGAYVKGWPCQSFDDGEGNGAGEGVLQTLLQRRLITADSSRGKVASPVQVVMPTAWIGEFRPRGWPRIDMQHIARFARTVLATSIRLRTMKMQSIIRRVSRRKAANADSRRLTVAEQAELVRVFDWLRPLAFHKRDTCLLYTLSLLEFLACYGVFPDWIFGVSVAPFKAHCWLQEGELLLTDTPFKTGALTPIMVV